MPAPLSIAAYGYVHPTQGSVATANHMILARLLDEGHRIEFHALGGFITPEGLIGREGFTFVPTTLRPIRAGWKVLEATVPRRLRLGPTIAYSSFSNALHERAISREIARRHAARPYDVLLALGALSPLHVPGLPCISWPQGPPQTEWEALRSLRPEIERYCGRGLFAALAFIYRRKERAARRLVGRSRMILCGSRWSADAWARFGVPREHVRPIPYPYDLDLFRPAPREPEPGGPFRFLWLGRIVPRKRLDLALEAFRRLRARRPDVELLIVGRFDYAAGFRKLLDEYADVPGLIYRESIPRAEAAALFSRVDCLFQPSENENLGSAPLEALCAGVPSLLGPTNGTADYLGDSCVVFDAYTPESVEAGMDRVIAAVRADRGRIAGEARSAAERFLPVETVTAQLVSAIREIG